MAYIHDISEPKNFLFVNIPIHSSEDPTFQDNEESMIGNLVEVEFERLSHFGDQKATGRQLAARVIGSKSWNDACRKKSAKIKKIKINS